ncbi:MAG: response regulator [Proteobacteria bacterium]|nr:response regulator [Pseudomonadota bacterium]
MLPDAPIVVIDDDPTHLAMLLTALERAGFLAKGFTSPRDGLYHLIDHPAALAVIDLCMPELDGLELVRRLQVSRPELPLIAMSGADGARSYLRSMRDSGATTSLRKPLMPDRFVAAVRDVLCAAA